MPAQTPNAADALRRYSRAVVLLAPQGTGSRSFQNAVRESGVTVELIGHPLLAMADLCRIDRDGAARDAGSRIALFVVDRDLDDLEPLFTAVQTRLPRVSIWVVQGDIVIPVRLVEAEPSRDGDHGPRRSAPSTLPTTSGGGALPRLRVVEGSRPELTSDGEPTSDGQQDDAQEHEAQEDDPRSEAVTSAELDMLLGFFDDGRDGRASGERGGSR